MQEGRMTRILSDEQKRKAVDRARRWALANPEKVKANYLKALAKRRKGRRPPSTERAERATCSKCGVEKPAAEFGTAPFHLKRNGLRSQCMACEYELCQKWRDENRGRWLESVATNRSKNREREKEKSRASYYRRVPQVLEQNKRYEKANPEKVRAHKLVTLAVKRGDLIKPSTCSKCGVEEKLDAHHENYLWPLKVKWLCHPCHKTLHKNRKER